MTPLLILLCAQADRPFKISEDVEIRARARAWNVRVGGGAKGDEDNGDVAFDDDLDLDRAWAASFSLGLYAPESKDPAGRGGALVYESFSTSGEARLEGQEDFEGSVFPAGSTLKGSLRFQTFGADATLAGRDVGGESAAWGFSIGLHYLEAELRVRGSGFRESEEYNDGNLKFGFRGELRPCPYAFVLGRVALYTDFISLLFGADSGHYGLDAEISAGLRWGPSRLELGARVFAWTLTWSESEIDLVAYGPFAGLVLGF